MYTRPQTEFLKMNRAIITDIINVRLNELKDKIIETDNEEAKQKATILAREIKSILIILENLGKEKPKEKDNFTGL